MRRELATALALACGLAVPSLARADEAPSNASLRFAERRHTVALLELGIIALPGAPISASQTGGDTPFGRLGSGDATIQTGIHVLFRAWPDWVFGAGFLFGPKPTSDSEYGGLTNLQRTHSRSYVSFGGEFRYVPLHTRFFEAWVGGGLGVIIIADRFGTQAGDPMPGFFGDHTVTLRTEGLSTGIQAGVDWIISDHFVAGFTFRANHWFLPTNSTCSPIGDCTTLVGSANSLEFGLTVGYRIPL
ncbi:MAG TPA: hypothetical protein VF316_12885 [Polyangiaceae bacterium]